MAKILATIKAIITRLVFGAHGFVAIWQVTQFKKNQRFWYLSCPILLLFFEGIFTLTIKENQEWKWFCPSVFLYLGSVVPAIWLLELDKVDRRLRVREETFNLSAAAGADLRDLDKLLGVQIRLPEIALSAETWVTLIEQFLMLTLIVGRWMLPKGDLTRDQLSQLLLVYIGTAADIIEFFDSFKDDTIAGEPVLVLLTLAIWSWSLLQFTVVLSATRSRKSRGAASIGDGGETRRYRGADGEIVNRHSSDLMDASPTRQSCACCCGGCCGIDAWGIALNIVLQDAPFLAFRLLIILHYRIISYMNVFFTCKNTLVILLQLYRLYVVHAEARERPQKHHHQRGGGIESGRQTKQTKKRIHRKPTRDFELSDISVISGRVVGDPPVRAGRHQRQRKQQRDTLNKRSSRHRDEEEAETEIEDGGRGRGQRRRQIDEDRSLLRNAGSGRKDTGYSTASSQHSDEDDAEEEERKRQIQKSKIPPKKPPRLSRQSVKNDNNRRHHDDDDPEQSDVSPNRNRKSNQKRRHRNNRQQEIDITEEEEEEEDVGMKLKDDSADERCRGKKSRNPGDRKPHKSKRSNDAKYSSDRGDSRQSGRGSYTVVYTTSGGDNDGTD